MRGKPAFFKSLLVLVNLCIITAYLIACIAPFINTGRFWYLAYPGLVFPIICFLLICFIILWALLRSKWSLISLIVLLLGFQQIFAAFALNAPRKFSDNKKHNTLRVLQWNVSSWDEVNRDAKVDKTYRPLMMDLLRSQNADVMCFEEFFESKNTSKYAPNILPITKMGYPYHYYISSVDYSDDDQSGIAIFSKYPILDSMKFNFGKDSVGEHLLYTDIKVAGKIFRIFATHLQSVHFEQPEYATLQKIKRIRETGLSEPKTIASKLKAGYKLRYNQAQLVSEKIKESPYPAIICGDFNDVPNSSTYFKIRGDLQDAFLEKGTFIGRTFRFISPTLRIDYILPAKSFKVLQYQRINVPYSDHYPVETDLEY